MTPAVIDAGNLRHNRHHRHKISVSTPAARDS